jgi:glycoside/pentoside/hexuronide:cation symporter, GPH family
MSEPHPATPKRDRVSWLQLAAYGSGGLIPIALFNSVGLLIGMIGNISLGLSAFWLGLISVIPRLWEAACDPVVGYLSDHTRSRWGRRRPYILLGGLLAAVSFVGIWWIPQGAWIRSIFVGDDAYQWFQLAFILAGLLAFFTAATIFEIPHGALGLEMSPDYHERTRLFSAKSFLGNVFAMGTPWMLLLAQHEFFSGPGGKPADGMRYVSLLVAACLAPLSIWWFVTLREPRFAESINRPKATFWEEMRLAASNRTFLRLTAAIFVLATGFNFVALFGDYITIFYLFDGVMGSAATVVGVKGTVWAVTALVAVFPLNWLSRRLGKHRTLLIAVGLMAAAQISKIVCYDPAAPYLVLIPTAFLAAGMLMFFTLASSMIGDVCDAEELATGRRAEGTYFSVFWWFLKMGSAFASLVGGILLLYTQFDEKQNATVEDLAGSVAVLKADAVAWANESPALDERIDLVDQRVRVIESRLDLVTERLAQRAAEPGRDAEHGALLFQRAEALRGLADELVEDQLALAASPPELSAAVDKLAAGVATLKAQSPRTLFRMRLVEIGLPLVLCVVSSALLIGYPLTEKRCYEIKAELERRKQTAT